MNEETITQNQTQAIPENPTNADLKQKETSEFIPETPDGYLLPSSQTIPMSEEADKSFKELAYKLKLTNEQVKQLGFWANEKGERNIDMATRQVEKMKSDSIVALKNEWGLNWEANIDKAVKTAESLAQKFPDFKNFLDETGAGNDPRFIKTMTKIGEMMSEDSLPYSAPTASGSKYMGSMPVLDFSSMEK